MRSHTLSAWTLLAIASLLTPAASARAQRSAPSTIATQRLRPDSSHPPLVVPRSVVLRTGIRTTAPHARETSFARHFLWGAGIGGLAGLGVGMYSRRHNSSGCNDCYVSVATIPLAGFLIGATAGGLIGTLTYFAARADAPSRS